MMKVRNIIDRTKERERT